MRKLSLLALAVALSCGGEPAAPIAPTTTLASASASAHATITPPPAAQTVKRVVVSLSRRSGTSVTTVARRRHHHGRARRARERSRAAHRRDGAARARRDDRRARRAPVTTRWARPSTRRFARDGRSRASGRATRRAGDARREGPRVLRARSPICPTRSGWLVQAAIKAGGTLPLLPGGEARIEKTGDDGQVASPEPAQPGAPPRGLRDHRARSVADPRVDERGRQLVRRRLAVVVGRAGGLGGRHRAAHREAERARSRSATRRSPPRTRTSRPPRASPSRTRACSTSSTGGGCKDQTVVVVGDTIKAVGPSATREAARRARGDRPRGTRRSCPASGTCTRTSATATACSTSRRA